MSTFVSEKSDNKEGDKPRERSEQQTKEFKGMIENIKILIIGNIVKRCGESSKPTIEQLLTTMVDDSIVFMWMFLSMDLGKQNKFMEAPSFNTSASKWEQ